MRDRSGEREAAGYVGAAYYAAYFTGGLSLAGAIISLILGNVGAMGSCLLAAAVAFGLLANAVLRQ
jgi:hypothetical protein